MDIIDSRDTIDDGSATPQGRKGSGLGLTALVLGSLGIASLALYSDPAVRAAVRAVATDPRVRSAAGGFKQAVADSWREHGGPEAAAGAVKRGSRVIRVP